MAAVSPTTFRNFHLKTHGAIIYETGQTSQLAATARLLRDETGPASLTGGTARPWVGALVGDWTASEPGAVQETHCRFVHPDRRVDPRAA